MENLSKSQSLAKRKLRKIQDTGITAFVIGVFFLFSPLFAGSNKILKPLAENLSSTVSWTFILIGVGLIGLYALLKQIKRKDKSVEVVKTTKSRTKSKPVGLLTTSTEQIPTLTPARSSVWSKQVFVDIEWRRFEAVCEGFYSQGKLKTKSQSHGADGGVDIWMYFADPQKPVSVVQCKNYSRKMVGVDKMREFFGVMKAHGLSSGQFVTSSTFSADAQKFADEHGINAVDGDKLLKLIATRTPEQQKELLDIAYEGDYAVPTCVSCGIKMVERIAKADGKKFWGCSHYPKCKRTIGYVGA